MTLRNRFTAFFVAFAVLISALGGVLTWNAAHRALEEQLDRELLSAGQLARETMFRQDDVLLLLEEGQDPPPDWFVFQDRLRQMAASGVVDRADIFRWRPGDLEVRALVTPEPPDSIAILQRLSWVEPYVVSGMVQEAYERGAATTTRFELEGRDYRYGILPLRSGETFLILRIPEDHLEPLRALTWTIVALSLAAAALAALIGRRLATGIVSRLEVLSRGALRIQRGMMDRPFDLEGEDEVGRLARAMERMRTGIQRRDEQLRLMLSRVAHEIRNPLAGLELFAAEAQETDDREERQRILGRVRREVVGLNSIINEFLGFARPGRTELELHDVRDPVSDAVSLAEAEVREKGGELYVEFPTQPLLANADPRQVKRLVLNLLRNAAHAGETVWVEGAMVNGQVRIAVRDDGPGVPEEIRDRIFEPFVGDKAQGAGLGLAIVKEMAEANHGRVELVGQEAGAEGDGLIGGGAEFHVYFSGPEDLPTEGVRQQASQEEGVAK
ncbi:MAG: HAMP domain-containing sensor histidine kinase [Gemmatimonadetes bacterium]|nr:HAMP domain-containing sensor histidine kinase [Gemmatimonadota bacterium]MCY3678649.1 HAMP domain-containing sensor histidine kinase [Gemmatimonadota bacterium]